MCDKCGVEVTKAKVRRERMGHIELAAPVSLSLIHIFPGLCRRTQLLLYQKAASLERRRI